MDLESRPGRTLDMDHAGFVGIEPRPDLSQIFKPVHCFIFQNLSELSFRWAPAEKIYAIAKSFFTLVKLTSRLSPWLLLRFSPFVHLHFLPKLMKKNPRLVGTSLTGLSSLGTVFDSSLFTTRLKICAFVFAPIKPTWNHKWLKKNTPEVIDALMFQEEDFSSFLFT